jgi:hypothetical protein
VVDSNHAILVLELFDLVTPGTPKTGLAMDHDDALLRGRVNVYIIDSNIDILVQDAINSSASGRLDGICP